jgi:hypothetical protein
MGKALERAAYGFGKAWRLGLAVPGFGRAGENQEHDAGRKNDPAIEPGQYGEVPPK